MRVLEALQWFGEGQRLAWRSLIAGTLGKAGLRPAVGAFVRPLTAPSRYPEYDQVLAFLRDGVDLADPSSWLLDIGSPKLFSMLLAARTKATVVATDIWQPAIDEAEALRGGLAPEVSSRLVLAAMDARQPVPKPLAPPSGLFAGAFSMSVVEHIDPDPGGDVIALRQVAASVRPGGCVVISVPVDREARSEYLKNEMYGRTSDDPRGTFFQRVYDAASLGALSEQLANVLSLEAVSIVRWPSHPIMQLQPKFPTMVGFLGSSFPLLAPRFEVSGPTRSIPSIAGPGDAVLRFRRRA